MTEQPTPAPRSPEAGDHRHGQAAGQDFDPATVGIMPDTQVTELHLLRHGAVQDLERRVVRGQMDVALSERGLSQSRALATWAGQHLPQPARLYSSDLARCSDLGKLLSDVWSLPLEESSELREQSMGRWEGHAWEEITEWDGPRVTAYWDDYVHTRPPDGESLLELSERANDWWQRTLSECAGQRLVVVTHVGFIRAMLCNLLAIDPSEALRFAPATASHTSLLISAAGAVLSTFGERPWLFGDGGESA